MTTKKSLVAHILFESSRQMGPMELNAFWAVKNQLVGTRDFSVGVVLLVILKDFPVK